MGSLASKAAKLFERTAKNPTVESKAKKILWTKEDHSRNELMGTAMGVVGPTTEKVVMDAVAVKARHILVKSKHLAEEAKRRVEAGEAFGKVAMEMSYCPSKTSEGSLGWLEKGATVKEFEDAAFHAPTNGEMLVVQTSFGWHVLAVDDAVEGSHREDVESEGRTEFINKLSGAVASHAWPEALAPGAFKPDARRKLAGASFNTPKRRVPWPKPGRLNVLQANRMFNDYHDNPTSENLQRLSDKYQISVDVTAKLIKYVDTYVVRVEAPKAKDGMLESRNSTSVCLSRSDAKLWNEKRILTEPLMRAAEETIVEKKREKEALLQEEM